MLKSKHYNTQDEWMHVWNNYDKIHSREYIEKLIFNTVDEIKSVCDGNNVAYAWSGGKDSIALQIVCEDAGVKNGFCCYNDLYFTDSIKFFKENTPNGIELYNSGEDIKWLSKNQKFLFPKKPHIWNVQTHLRYQPIFCRNNNIDILMMGKRSQDGNNVNKELVFTNSKNVSVYCPIRNWTHEDVICAIRYRGKGISPIYFTDDGFHYGDTKFAVMCPQKNETLNDAWMRIYKIEPDKVKLCALYGIQSAIEFMNTIGE